METSALIVMALIATLTSINSYVIGNLKIKIAALESQINN